MRVQTASVVGIPSKTSWSTTATVRRDGREVFVACGFSGDERAPHDGRRFIRMIEEIRQPEPQGIYQALEDFLADLSSSTAVSLAVVLKSDDQTAIFSYGFGLIGLVRDGRGRWLADGSKERVVLEGEIRGNDRLLLATARAKELSISLDRLANQEPDDTATSWFSAVQSHPSSGEIAVLILESQTEGEKPEMGKQEQPVESAALSSATAAKHLISPKKIEAGILASQSEQSQQINTTLTRRDYLESVRGLLRNRGNLIKLAVVGGVVLLLIVAMVVYRGASVAREHDTVVAPLEQLVSEALALPPEQIGEQRAAVQSLRERLQATRVVYGANSRRLRELLDLIEQKNTEISGEKELVNLPVFYDFRLVSAEFLASRASREQNRAVFLDSGNASLVAINLETKQNETYPREGLGTTRDVVLSDSVAYVLEPNKILSSKQSLSTAEVLTEVPDAREPLFLDRFGDSLYVFDREGQQIWRVGTGEEASPSGWIRSARGLDFSSVTSMVINGSIWLGTNDGTIFEFVRGERQNFSPSGLVKPFSSTILLAVTEEGERLVVVEPAQKRLVVLAKTGEYQLQVESEQIGAVTDVFLSEDEKSVYLVAGSVVYKVEI